MQARKALSRAPDYGASLVSVACAFLLVNPIEQLAGSLWTIRSRFEGEKLSPLRCKNIKLLLKTWCYPPIHARKHTHTPDKLGGNTCSEQDSFESDSWSCVRNIHSLSKRSSVCLLWCCCISPLFSILLCGKIHALTCSVGGLHVLYRNLHLQQFHELMSSWINFLQLPSVHQM